MGFRKEKTKDIARERIWILFQKAADEAENRPELARRHVHLARKISLRNRVKTPANWKRSFCKHCCAFWLPGTNCRVRTTNGKVTFTCLACERISRMPYLKEKAEKKNAERLMKQKK